MVFDRSSQAWRNLPGWQRADLDWPTKAAADAAGCNVGLLLGVPGKINGHDVSFAAIDIDFNEHEEACRNAILKSFSQAWGGYLIPVRSTVPWRGMLLAKIADVLGTGRKAVFKLSYEGREIGKIELLTTGQQAVIAGEHESGRAITWQTYGNGAIPRRYRSCPPKCRCSRPMASC